MENMDGDESEEVFQECDNAFGPQEEHKKTFNELKFNHINTFVSEEGYGNDGQETNNNHYVVHVGIIMVFLAIHLGMSNMHKCLVTCVENTSINDEQQQQNKAKMLNYLQENGKIENTQILERLLEYRGICKDLEIFTKDIKQTQYEAQEKEDSEVEVEVEVEGESGNDENNIEVNTDDIGEDNSVKLEDSSGSVSSGNGDGNGNGDCTKAIRSKHKKSKYSIKTTTTKNGFNKYNKSTKAKYQKNEKRDLNLNKKNSTAEPIIYLFALVFIYLLLKAASDINQHYKSQNKNDKRLRRCSLQSYAQIHRPDRRASKELALKQKQHILQQRLKSLPHSSSQDQKNYHYNHQQQYLVDGSLGRTQKAIEQKPDATNTVSAIRRNTSYSSKWQLLRQHAATQSLDNSDILSDTHSNAEISFSMMTRRSSVPATLSYQRQKLSTASPLGFVNDHANLNISLSKRTSITSSSLPLVAPDPNDSLVPEVKRRVRMINRH